MALRIPKQNRVAKITRVMLDLTRFTVALPSLGNRRPSCVPRLSTIKRFSRQSIAIQRDCESTSATCLSSGSFDDGLTRDEFLTRSFAFVQRASLLIAPRTYGGRAGELPF